MDEQVVRVADVRTVGPNTVAIDVETPEGFEALPGQFVLVRATVEGEELSRYYTLSSPTVDGTFELTVGVDPDGDISPWLAERSAGDELSVEGPFGKIHYDDEGDVVVVAGGPGVGPAVAIAERAVDGGHEAVVIYQDDGPAHTDRLDALDAAGANVRVFDDDADDELRSAVGDHGDEGIVYVFGFADFCELVTDALEAAGLDAGAANVESFG